MLRVAFQMDPLERLKPETDSTLLLIAEALGRGHDVMAYTPDTLSVQGERVTARGVRLGPGHPRPTAETTLTIELADCDVIWIRQDPPFSVAYLVPTYVLERCSRQTCVLNAPAALRNYPEKLWPLLAFEALTPPSLLTRDSALVRDFLQQHQEVVLKPLFGYGGAGVSHVSVCDVRNLTTLLQFYLANPEPVLVQKYLPDITRGDTRVFFLQGELLGAVARQPAQGQFLSNLSHGSQAGPTTLSPAQEAACAVIAEGLRQAGLFFAGVDLIGDRLLEINVTSPTLIPAFNAVYNTRLERRLWDAVEAMVSDKS